MWHIMRQEAKLNYRGSAIWALVLAALTYMMMYLFPSIAQQQAQWDSLISQLPKGVLAGFGMDQLKLSDIFGYYGTQVYPLLVLFAAIYAVMLFAQLLSKEESEGTIEFLLAKPVSRTDIFLGKLGAGLALAIAFNVVLFLGTWASFAQFHTQPYDVALLAWFGLGILLVTLVFAGFGLLLSAYIVRPRTLSSLTIGIVVITYILGIASAMSSSLHALRWVSPFQFVDATAIVQRSAIPASDWLGLLVVTAVFAAWSFARYRTKDILV